MYIYQYIITDGDEIVSLTILYLSLVIQTV